MVPTLSDDPLDIGATLSHYKILEKLDRGGMGIVYRALDVRLNREVALKVLPPELVADSERKRRFIQEAQAAAALESPYIAVVHEIDEAEGMTFVAMELIRGETLRELLHKGKLSLNRFLELATEVAEGLSCAHEKGVVHRDLKPSNIMVTEHGHAKIIDFGLAKLLEPLQQKLSEAETPFRPKTESGIFLGTASYMSPEQARGARVDHRSDIFSLGVVLYEMLTGEPPFQAASVPEVLNAIINTPAPPLGSAVAGDGAAPLESIVHRCLAKDPGERYQSMVELGEDLRAVRRVAESGAARAWVSRARHIPRLYAGCLAVAILVLVLGLFLFLPPADVEEGPVGSSRSSVAVLYFENVTGDPSLDWLEEGLADMLITDLSQSPSLEVISMERLYEVLEGSEQLDERPTSLDVLQRIADGSRASTVIWGRFMKAGDSIRINIRVQDPRSGKILTTEKVEGVGEASLFPMVDDLTRRVKRSFEISREQDAGLDHDLKEVTTSSIEAYRLYAEGIHYHLRARTSDARRYFERALEVDPGFAMAMAKLAVVHYNAGRFEESDRYRALALEHSDRLTTRERYYIEGLYYSRPDVTKSRAIAAYRKAIDLYPDHSSARHNLGLLYYFLERFDECIEEAEELRRRGQPFVATYELLSHCYAATGELDAGYRVLADFVDRNADNAPGYRNLGRYLAHWGRLEEASEALARAESLSPGSPSPAEGRWIIAALQEDWDQARALAGDLRSSTSETWKWRGSIALTQVELFRGRSQEALAWLADEDVAARSHVYVAHVLIEKGLAEEALEQLQAIPPEQQGKLPEWQSLFFTGLAQARLGREAEARETARKLEQVAESLPTDREKRRYHHLSGDLALARKDYRVAIDELERARSMLPARGIIDSPPYNIPQHVPIWFSLASAYMASGQEDIAAEWLARITESTIEHLWWPIPYVRSFYLLGRIHENRGDTEKASQCYRRFYEYWKDGDLDREWVKEAKGKLHG